jgi:glyoxylase-like metal-dependent hydrolase (beta-lactamase superfamily II)
LEDELGDVLEKAMRNVGLTEKALAERCGVTPARLLDAINYRPDLSGAELCRVARALGLNEIGLCALGCGQYPLPPPAGLPFCVHALRMPYGIGVANAYIVTECGAPHGVLFDTGPGMTALEEVWPAPVRKVDAVFLTHVEGEHVGGLCDVLARFGATEAFCPVGSQAPCSQPIGEGSRLTYGTLQITAFSTPGHTPAHNCYLVESTLAAHGKGLLVSGDLFFAGSVGCAHYCPRQLATNLRRMLQTVPPQTVIAPGHGPMTTAENELRYNPFVV